MKVLLTGATGFIGKSLVVALIQQGFEVSIAVRQETSLFPNKVKQFVLGDFDDNTDFSLALKGVDCVIHLAGKAHVIDRAEALVLNEFRKTNTKLTLSLARQATTAGVERFIFLSSIRVNGNQSNKAFLETDIPNPQEPYAVSKYEAEQGLLELAENSSLNIVIIRPPLVYGKDVPGNFGRLIKWINAKIVLPLPLGSIHNSRSLVAIDNLVSFIITCVTHPKAINEVFLISDGDSLSTTQLLKNIAKAFNKKALLLPIPASWMIFMAKILGKKADAIRLFSSLVVDSSKANKLLNWYPVVTMNEQLRQIAEISTKR